MAMIRAESGVIPRSNGYILPCVPTRAYKVPTGSDWLHEIKQDGYRLEVRRDTTAPSSPA
jgi:hypothetical protein